MEPPERDPLPRPGKAIAVRRLRENDLAAFQAYRRDEETGRYQGWTPQTDAQAKAFLAQMARAALFVPGEWIQLGIAAPGTDELVGDIGICVAADGKEAEIGFTLRPRSRGAGLGTEAVREAIGLVFELTKVARVVAVTDARNASSIRLLERAGLGRVDTVQSTFRGEPCVEHVYALARVAGRCRPAPIETVPSARDENLGYLLGLIAVAAFAVTLPATRAAVRGLDPVFVGLGRAIGAAVLGAAFLWATRARLPTRAEAKGLVTVALGVVVGFPLFTAWAMRYVDASHGGVVLGLLPLATAAAGALFSGERPSARFWVLATIGTALVAGYSLTRAGGTLHLADLALFAAIASAGVGYAEGARLSRTLGGLQVISWALLLSAPVLIVPVVLAAPSPAEVPLSSWLGFLYVMVISQFLGFVPWYRGLALGGIAKVGQTQLLQPLLTIAASVLLLGERADRLTWIVAGLVLAVVALGKRARVSVPGKSTTPRPSPRKGR